MKNAEKTIMSLEELRKLNGYELAKQMWPFEHDDKNRTSSEDDPEQAWGCLISSVESEEIKLDDLPSYGFYYFHPEKMAEAEINDIDFYLKKASDLAEKVGLTKDELIEKLKSL